MNATQLWPNAEVPSPVQGQKHVTATVTGPNSGGTGGSYLGASGARFFFYRRQVRAPTQASAGTASLTSSSWPTVSLPKSTGLNAPIATTAKIVPKKIVAEPVCGSIRNGASTPANKRPVDSPKGCP